MIPRILIKSFLVTNHCSNLLLTSIWNISARSSYWPRYSKYTLAWHCRQDSSGDRPGVRHSEPGVHDLRDQQSDPFDSTNLTCLKIDNQDFLFRWIMIQRGKRFVGRWGMTDI